MPKSLVIVESPAKARTISKFLGSDFTVESSIGHVRDLPSSAAEIPERLKKEPWARLGVDVDRDFQPLYIVPREKRAQIEKLKKALAKAEELYLATDEDREGEAIAWHLREVLKPAVPVKRMVFDEITKSAIESALSSTREIDQRLVSAQEARRVLDRLYGYEVSPVLWRKVRPRLSAGRVQSVATRLVVDRERARMRFRSAGYWDLEASFEGARDRRSFSARLLETQGQRVAGGRDFDDRTGAPKTPGSVVVLDEAAARRLASALQGARFTVTEVKERPFTRRPYAPFITSTLQQEAARKLRLTAQRAMRVAQNLYENGYITYMRTDSTQLSNEAIQAARSQIAERFGAEYLPPAPRTYTSRARNAQEAHEAIRPAGSRFRTPQELEPELEPEALRLYELIWQRTLASQMKDAEGSSTTVRIEGAQPGAAAAVFSATGRTLRFAGFLRVYDESRDDESGDRDEERVLPALLAGDPLSLLAIEAFGHATQPPARYTEATLIAELEERGIGRPSTYASILQTIQDRGYVWKKGSALVPTFTAFAVTRLLEEHLPELVDYQFTARMEDDLDAISRGEVETNPWLHAFYFGDQAAKRDGAVIGLKEMVGSGWQGIDARAVCSLPLGRDEGGQEIAVRVGRYGPYLQVGDSEVRANLREDIPPEELTLDEARRLLASAADSDQPLGVDPASAKPVYRKTGPYGDYVQLGDPELDARGKMKRGGRPKMASLWPTMNKNSLTLENALFLLSFPREVGRHPETDVPITVQDGRFGPFLKMGEDTRSLQDHEQLRTLTLEQALELLRQPKPQRGRRATTLCELGAHPQSGEPLQIKSGRYGPYVTDGKLNASLPRGVNPEVVTVEQALALLQARADKLGETGDAPKPARRSRGAAAKKAPPRVAKKPKPGSKGSKGSKKKKRSADS